MLKHVALPFKGSTVWQSAPKNELPAKYDLNNGPKIVQFLNAALTFPPARHP
jgi:hypothetical protein